MKLSIQNTPGEFEWPADWPQPTREANCSPLLVGEAYGAFKRDIKANGLYDKIHFTPDGKLSKGRTRYRALRELGKSHDEIVEKFAVTVKSSPQSDLLSNLLRVHRSKLALVASFAMANPESLKTLLADRQTGKKSGEARKIAAIVGCHANVVTEFIDFVYQFGGHMLQHEFLALLAADNLSGDDLLELLAATIDRNNKKAAVRNIEKLDTPQLLDEKKQDRRVRVTPEKREEIKKAHAAGISKRAIARGVGLDGKTVDAVLKEEFASAPEPKETPAPEQNEQLDVKPESRKAAIKPEVEILRKAFAALGAPLPLVFKEWVIKIHKIAVAENLLRDYLDEVVELEIEKLPAENGSVDVEPLTVEMFIGTCTVKNPLPTWHVIDDAFRENAQGIMCERCESYTLGSQPLGASNEWHYHAAAKTATAKWCLKERSAQNERKRRFRCSEARGISASIDRHAVKVPVKKSPVPAQEVVAYDGDALLLLEITKLHAEVMQGVRQTIATCIRIGELLTKKKSELAHGSWEPWIKAHAPFSSTTAWRYMRCFEKRADLSLSSTKDLPRSIERFAQISVEQEPPLLLCYDDEAISTDLLKPEQSEFELEMQSMPPLAEQPTARWQARSIAGQLIALLERVFQDNAQRAQVWDSIKLTLDETIQQQQPKSNPLIADSWIAELYVD